MESVKRFYNCSICKKVIDSHLVNYPHFVCLECDKRALNIYGKPARFMFEFSEYRKAADKHRQKTGMVVLPPDDGDNPVFIDEKKCWRRYRFGVAFTMLDNYNCRSLSEFYHKTNFIPNINNKFDILSRLEEFIGGLIQPGIFLRELNPSITSEEENLFLLAIRGNGKLLPIVEFRDNVPRNGEFYLAENFGKGPYHLLELPRDNKTSLNREYITQIAAFAKLYYEERFSSNCIYFEYNYQKEIEGKKYYFPMDIVIINPKTNELILYVEVKKSKAQVDSLVDYLKNNDIPLFNEKDRGIRNGDNIRKAKYLMASQVPFLWLAYPENVGNARNYFYAVQYIKNKIILVPLKSGIRTFKKIALENKLIKSCKSFNIDNSSLSTSFIDKQCRFTTEFEIEQIKQELKQLWRITSVRVDNDYDATIKQEKQYAQQHRKLLSYLMREGIINNTIVKEFQIAFEIHLNRIFWLDDPPPSPFICCLPFNVSPREGIKEQLRSELVKRLEILILFSQKGTVQSETFKQFLSNIFLDIGILFTLENNSLSQAIFRKIIREIIKINKNWNNKCVLPRKEDYNFMKLIRSEEYFATESKRLEGMSIIEELFTEHYVKKRHNLLTPKENESITYIVELLTKN